MPTPLALYYLSLLSNSLLDDNTASDFGSLGNQLLGGFAVAVAVAIAYTFIKLRLRDRNPPAPFISITSQPDEDVTAKRASD
jgi:hypothetical protein